MIYLKIPNEELSEECMLWLGRRLQIINARQWLHYEKCVTNDAYGVRWGITYSELEDCYSAATITFVLVILTPSKGVIVM